MSRIHIRRFIGALPFVLLATSTAGAGEVAFRRHVINADSQFSACAVFDVDHDGDKDIVSGGYWYAAPTWEKHELRDVDQIRGRFDDYSNLPLDVNGDGWLDLVSCNYRSKSVYWVENPGQMDIAWPRHVIDTPGASETGRLADIDGDGDLDVLPNGTDFAAWYELREDSTNTGPSWLRHELPPELARHGIGHGDINGDGRGDLVSPAGWCEAPEDRRDGRWLWHPEFRLHRDCGLPILVHDFDGDGDADIFWGRGHNIGLYWLEQQDANGNRTWHLRPIDTSWSQAHSIMLADIDGDGQEDVVAGKRFMGHDGKDPSEYDPLRIFWYSFDRGTRTWRRHFVSWGHRCGFDLDPKCADIDDDGDIDIVAAARSGLFLLENLRVRDATSSLPPPAALPTPEYEDHADLLVARDEAGQLQAVDTPHDWALRRSHILRDMQSVMGQLPGPSERVPLDIQVESEEQTAKYLRRKLTFRSDADTRVPAYLLIPHGLTGPAPAMLCLHPTSPLGKAQICGLGGKPSRFYAHELAELGYVCLAPDYPSFGDYQVDFAAQRDRFPSGTLQAIWDNIRALDLLETLPDVDRDRIGCIGHSLGGHNGLFTSVFDGRIRAMVTSCGFTAFADYKGGDLTGWTSDRYMPRIRDLYDRDPQRMPFDFTEVLAALAPRPLFVNAPLHDDNFDVAGVRKVIASARQIYDLREATSNLTVVYPDAEHDFPDDVRQQVYAWLDRHLKE